MADFDTAEFRAAARFSRTRADQIANRSFPIVMRGYDRAAVDAFVQEVLEIVRELEGRQSQESVVQKAIEEVGEETAGILQRAHETADEIAARSRSQAQGRLERAEREAELLRQEADAYSEKIVVDTQILWDERQRLIEEIRQLADDVLATADDAAERVSMPQMISDQDATEQHAPTEDGAGLPFDADGPPTEEAPASEVELDVLEGGAGVADEADEDENQDQGDRAR